MTDPDQPANWPRLDWNHDPRAFVSDPDGDAFVVRVVARGHLYRDWSLMVFGPVVWALSELVHAVAYREKFVVVVLRQPNSGWSNQRVVKAEMVRGEMQARNRAKAVATSIRLGTFRLA